MPEKVASGDPTARKGQEGRGKREEEEEDEYITIGEPAGGERSCDSSRSALMQCSSNLKMISLLARQIMDQTTATTTMLSTDLSSRRSLRDSARYSSSRPAMVRSDGSKFLRRHSTSGHRLTTMSSPLSAISCETDIGVQVALTGSGNEQIADTHIKVAVHAMKS
eukprot:768766-Hanusia_phi.AAC.4